MAWSRAKAGILLYTLFVCLTLGGEAHVGDALDHSWEPAFSWDDDVASTAKQAPMFEGGLLKAPANADPPEISLSERASVERELSPEKLKATTPGINCQKAHVANQYACEAYGEHSPVCTGSQTQYVLKCGHIAPRPLYHEGKYAKSAPTGPEDITLETWGAPQTAFIQEDTDTAQEPSEESGPSAPAMTEAQSKQNSTVVERTMKTVLEPVFLSCQTDHDKQKLACKKNIAKGYLEFRKANPIEETTKKGKIAAEDAVTELGSAKDIERVYSEAMDALHAHQQKLPPVDYGNPAASIPGTTSKLGDLTTSDFFDQMKWQSNVEEIAIGHDGFELPA